MLHVFKFLGASSGKTPPVVVLYGGESFLKQLALKDIRSSLSGEEDALETCFASDVPWRDVRDELSTVSLFGGGKPRLVIVNEADKFVTANRPALEAYVERPMRTGVLVLQVDQFPRTTKLYKAVNAQHGAIDCGAPEKTSGKRKVEDRKQIVDWLCSWSLKQHQAKLQVKAATLLLDLRGVEFGLLDQEIAKLALFAGVDGSITPDLVQDVTGGWKGKTIWELLDFALDGNMGEAMRQLDRLLHSGEAPVALFGQLSWSLRRFAAATHIYERALRQGRRMALQQALSEAGFRDWPQGQLARAEDQLKRLGRRRGAKLYRWLLELDLSLKGSHSATDRARLALELLFLKIASPGNAVPA